MSACTLSPRIRTKVWAYASEIAKFCCCFFPLSSHRERGEWSRVNLSGSAAGVEYIVRVYHHKRVFFFVRLNRECRRNQKEEMEMAFFLLVALARIKLKINHQLKFKTKGARAYMHGKHILSIRLNFPLMKMFSYIWEQNFDGENYSEK